MTRETVIQAAFDQMTTYLVDHCPDGENWEDFDPEIDAIRATVSDLLQASGRPEGQPVETIADHDLFNCCTGGTAPDWTRYSRLILAGCDFDGDDCVNSGLNAAEARFFAVYGLLRGCEPECEAITDIEGRAGARDQRNGFGPARRALAVAAELSRRSGLPVELSQYL